MRAREQVSQRGQAMPSVVAVVSIVAVVVALVAFFAGGDDTATAPQAQPDPAASSTTPTATAEPRGPQTAARAPARERARPEQDKAGKDEQRRSERKQRQKRRQQTTPDSGAPDVYVEVYNNTSISGLAAQRAAELQDAGWQVVGVDNWFGDIPASTVYYPAGLETEADALAEALGIGRVRGAVAPMKFDRLTVILTPDAA